MCKLKNNSYHIFYDFKGDSGGPLAIDNTVYGIVSFGIAGCANGLPTVYTNVYKYLPFIHKSMGKEES